MKGFRLYAILLAFISFAACSDDDFDSIITTDLETETLAFAAEGGKQTFVLESNDKWFIDKRPDWLIVEVKDLEEITVRSGSYTEGRKEVTVVAAANLENEIRTVELILSTLNGKMVKLTVTQDKQLALAGYWILSEGYTGQANAELAWYDIAKNKVLEKQFSALNDKPLGDTGNQLALYGSKMYVIVTGGGFTTETSSDDSYIEVINPYDGKSIKRIPFKNVEGTPAKPRNIIFEGGYGYVSSYSNEVVRLDTASLTLDEHAALSGTMAEGLTYNNGNLYVSNGGQGFDNKISVVDVENMEETKVISTAYNQNHIVSVSNGDIYFNTDWPEYKLYKLTIADEEVTEVPGLSVADLTFSNNNIYTSFYDWDNSKGSVNELNIATSEVTELNLELGSSEYHIGTINGSDLLYLTGMGDDIVIFDPVTKEIKHSFATGVPGGSGVVAVYR